MPIRGVYRFEGIDETLPLIPLAARRVLDGLGRKLSLEGWLSLRLDDRRRLVAAGESSAIGTDAASLLAGASPAPSPIHPVAEPDATSLPGDLAAGLGIGLPLDESHWRTLSPLDRYTLAKYASTPDKLASAYAEIVGVVFTHLTRAGEAHMVDVGDKRETLRRAVATASVRTTREVIAAIASGTVPKGDVLAVARIAGILAVKRTADLVPLCHPVRTTRAAVEFESDAEGDRLRVRAIVEAVDRTGVEMEAMVAASVASLTVYDMIKAVDRWAAIDALQLEAKSGGTSGHVTRPPPKAGPADV
jgi:cyclic pyranopterin phosphate synthase